MRYLLGAFAGVLFLIVQPAIAKEGTANCPALRFERRQVIPLRDFGRLAVDTKFTEGGAGTVVFRFFDVEDRPSRGSAHAVGLVYARLGDLGETPVGGYLWMTGANEIEVAESILEEGDGKTASMTFTTHRSPPGCPVASSTFTLKPDGRFYVDGDLTGTVR